MGHLSRTCAHPICRRERKRETWAAWNDRINADPVKKQARQKAKACYQKKYRKTPHGAKSEQAKREAQKYRAQLFELQNGMCPRCSKPLTDPMAVDHKRSLKDGGETVLANLQLLHAHCNRLKGSRSEGQ